MKRKILVIGLPLLIAFYLFTPAIGQTIYRRITPVETIESWKAEAAKLEASTEPGLSNEALRHQILRKLAQRGIHIDGGIRDEAIEHHINPYTITVMTYWRWKDFIGIP